MQLICQLLFLALEVNCNDDADMKHLFVTALMAMLFVYSVGVRAEEETLPVVFGGYVDTYYAYDHNEPPGRDRIFGTQPARHNEFNVNLVYLDARINTPRLRGRLALQAGTAVQSNYATEPRIGVVSGDSLSRHIQEAVVGYRVSDKLWIDGGIFFSHIGLESWISRDNWTYTRSMAAEFSPYYQSGVKASYQWTEVISTQLHVLNGWQNISENNGNKALGLQVAYVASDRFSLTYNNFLGNQVDTRWRYFNDWVAKIGLSDKLQVAAVLDFGFERGATEGAPSSAWQSYSALARYQLTPELALTARLERYSDPDQVINLTGTAGGFVVHGASMGVDFALHKQVLWRNELRVFRSADAIYPTGNGVSRNDGIATTSLSLGF